MTNVTSGRVAPSHDPAPRLMLYYVVPRACDSPTALAIPVLGQRACPLGAIDFVVPQTSDDQIPSGGSVTYEATQTSTNDVPEAAAESVVASINGGVMPVAAVFVSAPLHLCTFPWERLGRPSSSTTISSP